MKYVTLVFIVSLLIIPVPSLTAQDDQEDTYVITAFRSGGLETLDPHLAANVDEYEVLSLLCEGLVTFDYNLSILPQLATSFEESEDGLVYIFNLREDATFADIRPLTAGDVQYSIERLISMGETHIASFLGEVIMSIEVVDDLTVVFEIADASERDAFLLGLTFPGAFILMPELVEESEEFWLESGMCIGSYVLESWERGSETVLVLNDDYYGPQSFVEMIFFRDELDPSTQYVEFLAGNLDIAFVNEEDIEGDEGELYTLPVYEEYLVELEERTEMELSDSQIDIFSSVYPGPLLMLASSDAVEKLQQPSQEDSWWWICRCIPFLC